VKTMKELIHSYYDWLKETVEIKTVNEHLEVTTPFLDRNNDAIQFYLKQEKDGTIHFSDDGFFLNELEFEGIHFKTPKRKQILNDILFQHHLQIDEYGAITTTATAEDFNLKKHFYIQGLKSIDDLYVTNRNNVTGIFSEEVALLLEKENINYISDIKLAGRSGFDHKIDFIFPSGKKIPERYLMVVNNANKSTTADKLFLWNDIKGSRKKNNEMYVMLDDKNHKVDDKIIQAYKEYGIHPFTWTEKNNLVKAIKQTG